MTKFIDVYSGDTQRMEKMAISNKSYAEMRRSRLHMRKGVSQEDQWAKFARREKSKQWLGRPPIERLALRWKDYRDEWWLKYYGPDAIRKCS